MATAPATAQEKRGIRYWMERVIKECERAKSAFEADPVHDLRVALRRCRSMAEGFRAVDPDPTWRKMRKTGKAVFSALGELRDAQVMKVWVEKLGAAPDPVKDRLIGFCEARETELKVQAASAVLDFDAHAWLHWAEVLNSRERQLATTSDIFEVIALEKLEDALRLHQIALRNRSKVALHAVRIGIKRFRYIVENFLPERDQRWSKDLKLLQDILGEIHDLDVLWATALRLRAFASPEERRRWCKAITHERAQRVAVYRQKLVGRNSLFAEWRQALPSGEALRQAITHKFEVWANFQNPEPEHAKRVAERSLGIYDALVSCGVTRGRAMHQVDVRDLLNVAALLNGVARANGKHRKRVLRRLQKLDVPPGWTPEHLRAIGVAVRCGRGTLVSDHRPYTHSGASKRRLFALLGGILRLTCAIEKAGPTPLGTVSIDRRNGYLVLHSDRTPASGKALERIAARRYLLETACGMPILLSKADSP